MMKFVTPLALTASLLFLSACNSDASNGQQTAAQQHADSKAQQVCKIDQNFDISACETGQRLFFSPSHFGNEQLPLVVISYFCDIRQPVYFNNGGVVCIFRKIESAEFD